MLNYWGEQTPSVGHTMIETVPLSSLLTCGNGFGNKSLIAHLLLCHCVISLEDSEWFSHQRPFSQVVPNGTDKEVREEQACPFGGSQDKEERASWCPEASSSLTSCPVVFHPYVSLTILLLKYTQNIGYCVLSGMEGKEEEIFVFISWNVPMVPAVATIHDCRDFFFLVYFLLKDSI